MKGRARQIEDPTPAARMAKKANSALQAEANAHTQVMRLWQSSGIRVPPAHGRPSHTLQLLALQHSHGNRFVQRLVHPKRESSIQAIHEAAAHGIAASAGALPHLPHIQRSFGDHDISSIRAHVGPQATQSAAAMGAVAFATGDHVVFGSSNPSLHVAAHEAAHVVQQRIGVDLPNGVGEIGDAYERHADQVADQVVAGHSAKDLLDAFADLVVPAPGAGASIGQTIQPKVEPIEQEVKEGDKAVIKTRYWSSNADKYFDTEEEAKAADVSAERSSTLYTYTHAEDLKTIRDKPQGPHVVPHVWIGESNAHLKTLEDCISTFEWHVPSPDEVRDFVDKRVARANEEKQMKRNNRKNEKSKHPDEEESRKQQRREREQDAKLDSFRKIRFDQYLPNYERLYKEIKSMILTYGSDLEEIRKSLRRIMELHPYATYGWEEKKKANDRDLHGKGERRMSSLLTTFKSELKTKRFKKKAPVAYGEFCTKFHRELDEKMEEEKSTNREIEFQKKFADEEDRISDVIFYAMVDKGEEAFPENPEGIKHFLSRRNEFCKQDFLSDRAQEGGYETMEEIKDDLRNKEIDLFDRIDLSCLGDCFVASVDPLMLIPDYRSEVPPEGGYDAKYDTVKGLKDDLGSGKLKNDQIIYLKRFGLYKIISANPLKVEFLNAETQIQ